MGIPRARVGGAMDANMGMTRTVNTSLLVMAITRDIYGFKGKKEGKK